MRCGWKGTGRRGPRVPSDADKAKSHQKQWADHLDLPVETTNSVGMRFILIPPGEFFMGSPQEEVGRGQNEVQHRVQITRPFYLGVYEVTQDEYQKVIGDDPNSRQGVHARRAAERIPITSVDWLNATEFCRRLSALPEEREGSRVYRLSTEAEWEYACRAGTTTAFHFGQEMDEEHANCGAGLMGLKTVGSYAPNAFGLHDMHGSVIEWCADAYESSYYVNSPLRDPRGPSGQRYISPMADRVARGGGFVLKANLSRSATRLHYFARQRTFAIGFRVAMDVPRMASSAATETVQANEGVDGQP